MVSKPSKNYMVCLENVSVFLTGSVHNLLRSRYRSKKSDQDGLDMFDLLKIKFSRSYQSEDRTENPTPQF